MTIEPTPRRRVIARLRSPWIWAGVPLGALLLYALVGFFVVPKIISSQIREQSKSQLHRDASTSDVRFNPFTLATTIRRLRVLDRDGADLLSLDLLRIDLQVSGVFRRAWRFREIRVERPVASARILADGQPSIADLLNTGSTEPSQPPRLIIDRLTMTKGVVRFSDAARQPVYETRFEPLNLDITDLITIPQEGGAHRITIGVGDGAELRWSGRQTVEPLTFTGRLDIVGLDLQRLWEYAGRGQPLDIAGGKADIGLPYEIRRGANREMQATLKDATATVRALSVRPRDEMEDWLTVRELHVSNVGAAWPARRIDVGVVRVVRPRAISRLERDGVLNWTQLLTNGQSAESSSSAPGAVDTAPQVSWRVGSAEIDGGSVVFDDLSAEPAVHLEVADLTVQAENLSSSLATPVPVKARARVQEKGSIEVAGTVAPSPMAATVTFTTQAIDLLPLRAYIRAAPGARIAGGTASLTGEVTASDKPTLMIKANGQVDDVELRDLQDERVLAWRRMAIDGLTIEQPPDRLRVRRITLDEPFARIHIDREGNLNLTRLADDPGAAPAAPAKAGEPAAERIVEVGVVDIRNATADFSDDSLPLPFRTKIHSAMGSIRDVSSFAAAPATLALEGRVDETGYVKSDGTLRLSNPMASSQVGVEFRNIEMAGLTPYFADFAGYAVRKGILDLDVQYAVKDRRLLGSHKVVAKDLVLGDKVDGAKGAPFPVRLAIALLKDREGRINLDVPVEGTVDSPEFAYRKVFWSAVRTILANAATAPFRALGRMFGRDEDELELVEFDAGRSDLLPADQSMLTRLADQISEKPDLTMTVEGRFDAAADTPALKRAKLEQLIESRRQTATAAAAAAGGSTLETILEGLFVERFNAEALQTERQRFTKTPAPTPASSSGSASADATPAVAPPAAFDAAGFYESLRARLLEAQTVSREELSSLGTARSTSIVTALTASGAIAPTRIKVLEPVQAKRQKRGSARVASEMNLSADPVSDSER